jgi:hypothetical protein
VKFRGLAAGDCPSASRSWFIFRKTAIGITTSPRTSKGTGSLLFFNFSAEIESGTERIVRTLLVTSSPIVPSPCVVARASTAPPVGFAT